MILNKNGILFDCSNIDYSGVCFSTLIRAGCVICSLDTALTLLCLELEEVVVHKVSTSESGWIIGGIDVDWRYIEKHIAYRK